MTTAAVVAPAVSRPSRVGISDVAQLRSGLDGLVALDDSALVTTRLALAQLHQRDIELACSTAESVFAMMADTPIPGRMRSQLGDFYRDLITLAPKATVTREWADRFRLEWSRA